MNEPVIPYAVRPKIFELYGRAVFGMQAAEFSMRVGMQSILLELGSSDNRAYDELATFSFGRLINELDRYVSDLVVERTDLRSYVKNRNYLAHQFFIDVVELSPPEKIEQRVGAFLNAFNRESILASHRIATIAEVLKLEVQQQFSDRNDLKMMDLFGVSASERVLVRTLLDA